MRHGKIYGICEAAALARSLARCADFSKGFDLVEP